MPERPFRRMGRRSGMFSPTMKEALAVINRTAAGTRVYAALPWWKVQ